MAMKTNTACTLLVTKVIPHQVETQMIGLGVTYQFKVVSVTRDHNGYHKALHLPGRLACAPVGDKKDGIKKAKAHLRAFGFTRITVEEKTMDMNSPDPKPV